MTEGERDEGGDEDDFGGEDAGPGVGAGGPELAVANEGFVVDGARDEEPPADGHEDLRHGDEGGGLAVAGSVADGPVRGGRWRRRRR